MPRLSPAGFRRLALAAAAALAVIVVTGAAVRLTDSGLGCPTWPRCTATSYVAPASFHALVEFGNRLVTVAVGILVAATFLGAVLRTPRRRDLLLLSGGLVAGYAAQAVIGGLSVLYHLSPGWVMAHFLVSMAILWAAVLLYQRAGPAFVGAVQPVQPALVWLGRALVAVAGLVLVLGTVVTGAGPHAGSAHAPRLHLPLERVTQLHADAALFLTGLVLATLVALRVGGAPPTVRRRGAVLGYLLGAQVGVGYAQYFLDLPRGLVLVHVAIATTLWIATLWLNLSFGSVPDVATATARTEPRPRPRTAASST